MRRPARLAPLCLLLASALASTASAQTRRPEQLRVLRFQPAGLAEPLDSLVIAFDHPVAPELDRSVEPGSVVQIEPSVRTTAYWRDPSTVVVRFVSPLPYDARYRVTIAPTLRSESGVGLAPDQARELRVRPAAVLGLALSEIRGVPDSLQRPVALYEAAIPLGALTGRLVIGVDPACRATAPIPLVP